MKNLTLENITKVCNGIYHGPQEKLQEEVTAIRTDSRKVEKGGLPVDESVWMLTVLSAGNGSRCTRDLIQRELLKGRIIRISR